MITNKKAQIRMQEMAFMLVAVILFFVLVGLFLFSILYASIQKEARMIAEEKTLLLITNLADSPEFSCVASKPNSVDGDKAMALIDNKNYRNFWPFSRLEIQKSSAFRKNKNEMVKCTMRNYPDCERFVIFDKNVKNEITTASYVVLCRIELENGLNYEKCEIAKLIAGTELKTER